MKLEGVRIKGDYNLTLEFVKEPTSWERKMSELINDRVILDIDNGKRALEFFGDRTIYTVYNLWRNIEKYEIIKERTGLKFDLTLLKKGVFSVEKNGELFLTYGHTHEKNRGELYNVIKNECIILLSDLERKKSFMIELKEGSTILIHPKYAHRLISKNIDCLVLGIVPEDAGHNYNIVKGKGFPFHFFLEEGWIKIVENKKYNNHKIYKGRQVKRKISLRKLKNILYQPDNYKSLYKLELI